MKSAYLPANWRLFLLGLMVAAFSSAAAMPHEVYVWQRAWTEPVRRAVMDHGAAFSMVVVLKAEVTWNAGKPNLAQVQVDYQALAGTKRPVGLALRVGPYSGSFARTNAAILYLSDLAARLVAEAKTAGLGASELQLDFDCASSKLEGYRAWVQVIRERIAPVPLVITTLPAWLEEEAFKPLVESVGSFVLQVHSLERPKSLEAPFTICDPAAARRAVARAAEIGVAFRVALPTYGYLVAFDGQGRFIGISAEGPLKGWPDGARVREVRADPLQMAQLVQDWSAHPPAALKGVLWYRLPVSGDTLNWRWPTLSAMVAARIPSKSVRVESHRVEPGLFEISLVNDGELDISSRIAAQTRWREARLVAGDGLRGFELTDRGTSSARFQTAVRSYRLPAGEKHVIGWLRLSEDREVQVEMEESAGP